MRAIVIGRNYASRLGMARSAGEAGCDVSIIATSNKPPTSLKERLKGNANTPDLVCKYVDQVHYQSERDPDALIKLLLEMGGSESELPALLPCDDFAASVIDKNLDALSQYYRCPNVSQMQGGVERLMDKSLQKRMAVDAGLDVARGWTIEVKDGSYAIPDDLVYPCFLKPAVGYLVPKSLAGKCEDSNELKHLLDIAARRADCTMVVEEYLPIDAEYGVIGLAVKGKALIPGLVEKTMCGHGHQNGVTMVGKITRADDSSPMIEGIKRLIEQTNLTGLFDIDLCRCGERYCFVELNLRLGAFGYAATKTLVNLPGLYIHYLDHGDMPYPSIPDLDDGISLVSEKVAMDDYTAGYLSWKEYRSIVSGTDLSFIYDEDDLAPFRSFRRRIPLMRIKRVAKIALGE